MTYMRLVFGALLCLSQPLLLAKPGKYDVDPAAVSLAPAVINVTDEVINEDLMALTATSGEIPSALSESFAFGPLTFRTMFQTGADSADTLVPGGFSNGTRIAFDWFKDDFWKGASARVYRVRDGKLVKIRESEVVDSASSGLSPRCGSISVSATAVAPSMAFGRMKTKSSTGVSKHTRGIYLKGLRMKRVGLICIRIWEREPWLPSASVNTEATHITPI